MNAGYARCSTDEQDVVIQTEQLLALGVPEDRIGNRRTTATNAARIAVRSPTAAWAPAATAPAPRPAPMAPASLVRRPASAMMSLSHPVGCAASRPVVDGGECGGQFVGRLAGGGRVVGQALA